MVSQNKQYNKFAEEFNGLHKGLDKVTNLSYYSYFDENLKNKTLLDLGCGEGVDIKYFDKLGANSYGIDSSEKMVEISNKKYEKSNNKIRLGYFENIPFKDNTFDVVCSKYSIQTSENIEPIYREVKRVLKKNGEFIFLVVHPIRQFIEKIVIK